MDTQRSTTAASQSIDPSAMTGDTKRYNEQEEALSIEIRPSKANAGDFTEGFSETRAPLLQGVDGRSPERSERRNPKHSAPGNFGGADSRGRSRTGSDNNVWEIPDDMAHARLGITRRALGLLELMLSGPVLALGIYLLVTMRDLRKRWFTLFLYVAASVTADALLLAFIGALLCTCWVCCGEASVRHAAAAACIFFTCMQTITCYALAGGGLYFLLRHHETIRDSFPIQLLVYLVCETMLTTFYTLKTCPIVCGACRYLKNKVAQKARGEPIVTFYREYRSSDDLVNLNGSTEEVRQPEQSLDLSHSISRVNNLLFPRAAQPPDMVELAIKQPLQENSDNPAAHFVNHHISDA